jgi:hypothetical protein
MDPTSLTLIVGAGLAIGPGLVGFAIGRATGLAAGRREANRPAALECSCGHGYGSHANGDACNGKIDEPAKYDSFGKVIAWKKAPCTCLHYDGPEPLPRAWTPTALP